MAVTTVLLDLDDTLLVELQSALDSFAVCSRMAEQRYGIDPGQFTRAVRSCARELWHSLPVHPYCRRIQVSSWEGLWAEFSGDDPEMAEVRKFREYYRLETWVRSLKAFGVDDNEFAQKLSGTFRTHRRGIHLVFDDTHAFLDGIRPLFSLGLVTNGAPDLQRLKIEKSGLERYFSVIAVSGEMGVSKPEPEIFRKTLKKMNARASEAVMIGNSLSSDIAGARNAGIKSIWLNREGEANESGVKADFEAQNLAQVRTLLERLRS